MAANYDKLWKLLIDRHMTKTQMRLAVGLSTATLAKLNKGLSVRQSTIDRICEVLSCNPRNIASIKRERRISKKRSVG